MLLVGESPPANGGFFYRKSLMTIYTQTAFKKIYKIKSSDQKLFLKYFHDVGCYLDDLSHIPVDDKPKTERGRLLKEAIPALSRRLKCYKPEVIAIALKRIEKYVREAIDKADLSCPIYTLPFAGNGHQNKYIDELSKILKRHMNKT